MRNAPPHLVSISIVTFLCHQLGITSELIRLSVPDVGLAPGGWWIEISASTALAFAVLQSVLHVLPWMARTNIAASETYLRAHNFTVAVGKGAIRQVEDALLINAKCMFQHIVDAIENVMTSANSPAPDEGGTEPPKDN